MMLYNDIIDSTQELVQKYLPGIDTSVLEERKLIIDINNDIISTIYIRAPYQDKRQFISAHGRGGHREPRHPSRHAPHVWEQPPFYRLVVAALVRHGCSLVYPILGGGPLGYRWVHYDVISSFWYLSRAHGRGLGWVGNGSRHLPGSL